MKSLILVFAMATNAIAFEQIFAVNAGGTKNHTDSDGIVFTAKTIRRSYQWNEDFQIFFDTDDVMPQADRHIYLTKEYTSQAILYSVPLKSDGIYVLIAKFYYPFLEEHTDKMDLSINDDIQLLTNVGPYRECRPKGNFCDIYFYFCVAGNMIYYKNQSSLILNETIHIDLRPVNSYVSISGLVLLKGSPGEKQKLKNSPAIDPMFFDPSKMDSRCSIIIEEANEPCQNTVKLEEIMENVKNLCTESKSSIFQRDILIGQILLSTCMESLEQNFES
jgi:Malectin domain